MLHISMLERSQLGERLTHAYRSMGGFDRSETGMEVTKITPDECTTLG